MESPPRTRSTRDRPAKPPLSEDAIVDAALRILRDEGLDAVTMRRIATELDTGPASLYVYIRNRDVLLNAMLERVIGAVPLEEPDPGRWREQMHRLNRNILEAMEAHPGIARVAVANIPTGERALGPAENMLGLLLAGGIAPQEAAWAVDILPLITTASAIETAAHQERGHDASYESQVIDHVTAAFSRLPPDRFPNITSHAKELMSGDGNERFDWAIDVFLDGLAARAARHA